MKINPSSISTLTAGKDPKPAADRATTSPASANAPQGSDRVDLSALSTQIAALESSLVAEPSFDRARVDAIKLAIVEGRLTVNADVVADKMLSSALAMLDGGKR